MTAATCLWQPLHVDCFPSLSPSPSPFLSGQMEALFSKADAIRPVTKRRKIHKDDGPKHSSRPKPEDDKTLNSVSVHTKLPKSLRNLSPAPESLPKYAHIANKKLRAQLTRQAAQTARSKALVKDAELLLTEDAGRIEVEGELEKTWRVGQSEIVKSAGEEAARGRKEWALDGGPYRSRYTRNGRYASSGSSTCIY